MQTRSPFGSRVSWFAPPKSQNKWAAALYCFVALCFLGTVDYLLGYQISLLVFYILPIGFATLYVGPAFATLLAVFTVVVWKTGDFLSGMPYPGAVVLFWNGTIVFLLFLIVIGLLHALNRTLLGLETTVTERTKQLLHEMGERGRMEREIIDLSEKERQRFGQELHDVVCQELASVAIASHMLTRKLLAVQAFEAEHAREIALMIDSALAKTRGAARGFFIAGFDSAGLEEALRETVRASAERNRISCTVHWQENLAIPCEEAVIHLFRIAQEAFHNAVKHAGASEITISFRNREGCLEVAVEDNGKGFDASGRSRKGLGLNIMTYRAGLIGGKLLVERAVRGGTRVVCLVPIVQADRSAVKQAA